MIRFAFYGSVGAKTLDPLSHYRERELGQAQMFADQHGGQIVAEYYDAGIARTLPWQDRPQAAALLAELTNPQRGFDAVIIPKIGRALGAHHSQILSAFARASVPVWVPGLGGPLKADDPVQRLYLYVVEGITNLADGEQTGGSTQEDDER